jgi:23S rRNA pseudouridine1911/1915/1917 synthase
MLKKASYTVDKTIAGNRLDVAVSRLVPELTRTRVQKLIKEGLITVDGTARKANFRVPAGAKLEVSVSAPEPSDVLPEEIELDILYEDKELLVVNKPQGLVVHPAAGHAGGTLVNALLHHCRDLSGIGGRTRPGIVHRLDKDTSGLLFVPKNDRAHLSLAEQFKKHSVTREYVAIVHGEMSTARGTIDAAIARHSSERKKMAVVPAGRGRRAVTHFTVLELLKGYTSVALRLETGRTHQIRVHLAAIGHPVVGDPVYGGKREKHFLKGQALHARLLGFVHPTSNKYMEFFSEPSQAFQDLLEKLRK